MFSFIESIKMAVAALASNKMRAVLTTLGVVIGISTVLLMGWFLAGLDSALEDTLSIFGDDVLYVSRWDWTGGSSWIESRNRQPITMDQFERAKTRIRNAQFVVPSLDRNARTVKFGDLQLEGVPIVGAGAEYTHIIGNSYASGRFFNETEEMGSAAVAVLGQQISDNLFPGGNPIGSTIRIDGLPFLVIGTMPKRGALGMDFVDRQIIIPIRRFFSMFPSERDVTISVKAGGTENLEEIRYETMGVMRQVRSIAPGAKDDFAINEQKSFREQMDQIRVIVFGVGIAMTGLSFLVGSIGIMNIMFVSVTERTKEIGIRKALGATRASILTQFLVEAVTLCLIGSVIAFMFTSILAVFGDRIAESQGVAFLSPTLPPSQIVVAIVVSVMVGVLAGIIPAYRGARMNPVDALRAD